VTGTTVSATTVRRLTEQAGTTYVAVQEAAVDALETVPPPREPAQRLQLSVDGALDGALVPLVGGLWEEVKTLVVGYLCKAAQAACGAATPRAAAWLDVRLHTLRYGEPEQVVGAARHVLRVVHARGGSAAAQETITTTLGYRVQNSCSSGTASATNAAPV
jgi:hypothetical protein